MMLKRYHLASIVIVELAIAGVLWTMTSSQVIHGLLILWAVVETGALCRHLYKQRQFTKLMALEDTQEGFVDTNEDSYLDEDDDPCDDEPQAPSDSYGHGMEH